MIFDHISNVLVTTARDNHGGWHLALAERRGGHVRELRIGSIPKRAIDRVCYLVGRDNDLLERFAVRPTTRISHQIIDVPEEITGFVDDETYWVPQGWPGSWPLRFPLELEYLSWPVVATSRAKPWQRDGF